MDMWAFGCMIAAIAFNKYPFFKAHGNINQLLSIVDVLGTEGLYDYAKKFVGNDVRRLEAYVSATDEKANRLVKFFGFEPIGFRRQAGADGGDQVIYERLWRKE